MQTHPKYWPDPLLWQPKRWISSPVPADPVWCESESLTRLRDEVLLTPAPATYFPWSEGPELPRVQIRPGRIRGRGRPPVPSPPGPHRPRGARREL